MGVPLAVEGVPLENGVVSRYENRGCEACRFRG